MKLAGLRLLGLTFWGLIALAGGLTATLFFDHDLKDRFLTKNTSPPAIAEEEPAPAPPLSRYQELFTSLCFTPVTPSDDKPDQNNLTVELPSLDGFKLVGLMCGPEELSLAVVEEVGDGRQEMVGPGDTVGPGRVLAVLNDRILVDLKGQRHQLVLEDKTVEALDGILTIRSEFTQLSQIEPQPDPDQQALTDQGPLRLEPVHDRDFGVAVISPGRLGAALGLRQQDIIQAANPAEVQLLLDQLTEGRPTSLQIVRQGRQVSIHFNPL
jgi:type II secretory pathway component PulC